MALVLRRNGLCKALCRVLAGAILCASVGGASVGCAKRLKCTIEAGDDLPNPYKLIAAEGASYVAGFDEDCVNHPGTYTISMTDAEGHRYKLKLTVVDNTAPVVTSRHVYYALGSKPRAEDFINTIVEADGYTAYFDCDLPDMTKIGDYDVVFYVKDHKGNVSKKQESVMTVIQDTQAPTFVTVPELSAYVGEAIAYRRGLVVRDNCGGEVEITVDSSAVNPDVPGDYTVGYTASDASGNTSWAQTVIHIYKDQVTEEQLMERIAGLAAQITTPDMSKEQQLRAVYDYINVQKHISYVSSSDKSDWIRAAYDSLFVTGTGDCYNYLAAAKAFCVYFGIDHYEIERTAGAADGTHFWLLVNIGTADAPRWYHFDCTRLRSGTNSCLLTDAQIRAYNKVRSGFYAYNASAYPKSESRIITRTPDLEKYY